MDWQKVIIPLIVFSVCRSFSCVAQDTSRRAVTLPEVSIVDPNGRPEELRVQTPTQVIATKEMQQLGGTLLSDAARRLVGVTLKDYGGIGGIKTVSARGLGSQFSTLTIDGVAVNDCQNGQVDLGRYTLGNSSYISFANGQSDNLLQSARSLAAGSTLNMETTVPEFGTLPLNLSVDLEGGSYGYFSPTLAYQQRLGRKASFSLWSNYTRSDGNYPFTLYYTVDQKDSSSREYRQNSQMRMGTVDANFFYRFDSHRRLHIKAHYMNGFHALPGPVIYYTSKASEHTEEQLFFTQARYRKTGQRLEVQLLGKYQLSNDIYEDTAARTASGIIRNDYSQQEGYLSQTLRYYFGGKESGHFSVAFAADEAVSHLTSNLSKHNDVQRTSALGVLSAEYRSTPGKAVEEGLRINAHVLGTWIRDHEQEVVSEPYARLSPYAGVAYTRGRLTLRYFFKETYRVPNFNELYYFTVGRSLQPEKARQHNVGVSFSNSRIVRSTYLWDNGISVDGYYNRVSDKIIAVPMQNMFLWSMQNLGKVEVRGVDISATSRFSGGASSIFVPGDWRRLLDVTLTLGYSFQYAVDRTDPSNKVYGHQIPYTPRHSGSIALVASTKWVDVGYSATLVGRRYRMSQNTNANMVKGYVDQGIRVSRQFWLKHGKLDVKAQVLNLFDVQYEVVKNYPMMGRNYRVGVGYAF
ncbi:MAG: TonB-dependent receptor [Bacteroidales bacterium]|nr:TonB-dependent receptor [Bacteroidales bacterium]